MRGRLLLLQHPSASQLDRWAARIGPDWQGVEALGVRLLSRDAPWTETLDGRALGARTGVLYNLTACRSALIERGLPALRLHGDGVCAETIGGAGPRGLGGLARHGLVALLHRGQGSVLVASDAQGLAPLYVLKPPEGGMLIAGDRAALEQATGLDLRRRDDDLAATVGPATGSDGLWRVPPGVALLLNNRGLKPLPWQPTGAAVVYLRERPEALRGGDFDVQQNALRGAVASAADAWRCDRGRLGPPPEVLNLLLNPIRQTDAHQTSSQTAPPWLALGVGAMQAELKARESGRSASWHLAMPRAAEELRALMATHQTAYADSPFKHTALPEPEARLAPARRLIRWQRLTWWRCGPLEAALDDAAANNRTVALPHLAPAVVAILGALPSEARPWERDVRSSR